MAKQFQQPNLPNLGQDPMAGAVNQLGQNIQNIPLLYAQWQKQKKELEISNAQLDLQRKQVMGQHGTGMPNPGTTETPEDQINRLGTEKFKALHPTSGVGGSVPNSFEGVLAAKMKEEMANGMSLDDAVKKFFPLYREKQFPKVVSDPLGGAPNLLTTDGPQPIFKSTGLDNPTDAMLKLRQAAPKIAMQFDKILDDAYPQNNAPLRESITAAGAASKVKSILLDPNPSEVGLASLGFHLARMSGSNSQLSDAERDTFEAPLGLISKVMNKGYRIALGDLSPKMKGDLEKLSDVLEKRSRAQTEKLLNAQKVRAQRTLGSMYNPHLEAMFPTAESLIVGYDNDNQPAAASAAAPAGRIRVRNKLTGQTGTISEQAFNPEKYEKI